jgi:N-acetylneuraminic acid mutarotase
MPTDRLGLATTSLGGQIYALGGARTGIGAVSTVEIFTPPFDSWSRLSPMPTARESLSAAGVDGFVYALGGSMAGSSITTVERYNAFADAWEQLAPMGSPRSSFAAVAVPDGRVFALGGNPQGQQATTEVFEPSAAARRPVASLPTFPPDRVDLGVGGAVLGPDGLIFAISCVQDNLNPPAHPTNDCFAVAYSPDTDSWSDRASFHRDGTFRGFAVAAGGDARIYLIGGLFDGCPGLPRSDPQPVNEVLVYDPASDTWSTVAPMSAGRFDLTASTTLDGRIVVFGGITRDNPGDPLRTIGTVEEYDPSTNTWSRGVCSIARARMASATAADGRIIVVGGAVTTALANAEAYSP